MQQNHFSPSCIFQYRNLKKTCGVAGMLSLIYRSSYLEMILGEGVLKIWCKFTGEHPCQSAISIKLLWNFIEITLQYGCSPVNLQHIFRIPFLKNTFGWLLLDIQRSITPSLAFLSNENEEMRNQFVKLTLYLHYRVIFRPAS